MTRTISSTLLALVASCLLGLPATALEEGDAAPNFSAPRLEGGGQLSLSDYKGKVVFVDFWASWCGPCLTSLPLIEEMRKQFPDEDFQVVAINLDQDKKKARRFLAKHSIGYPSVSDPKGLLPERFGLSTMPSSYLLDRDGVVRYVHEGFRKGDEDELESKITQLVKVSR